MAHTAWRLVSSISSGVWVGGTRASGFHLWQNVEVGMGFTGEGWTAHRKPTLGKFVLDEPSKTVIMYGCQGSEPNVFFRSFPTLKPCTLPGVP